MSHTIVSVSAAAVTLLALFGVMEYYRIAAAANEQTADIYRISYLEPRYRSVAAEIPTGAVVGYDTNLESGGMQDDVAFRGAQYVLAPRLLRRVAHGDYGEYVIGNYTMDVAASDMIARAARELDLELVREAGNGVVLYRKRRSN